MDNICCDLGVLELTLFGSGARGDLRHDSDLDFLVVMENEDYGPWMGKLTELRERLSVVTGRSVDVVPKSQIKPVVKDQILREAQMIYAKR